MQNANSFKIGDRIRLISMNDPFRRDVPVGETGTVVGVAPPPINVLSVEWDNGFSLNPCLDMDIVESLSTPKPESAAQAHPTYINAIYTENGEMFGTTLACRSIHTPNATVRILKKCATKRCRELAEDGWVMGYDQQLGDIIELLDSDTAFKRMLENEHVYLDGVEPYLMSFHPYDEIFVAESDL